MIPVFCSKRIDISKGRPSPFVHTLEVPWQADEENKESLLLIQPSICMQIIVLLNEANVIISDPEKWRIYNIYNRIANYTNISQILL